MVGMTVRGWKGLALDVHLPVWRPGRYEILDLAGGVSGFAVTDSTGRPLAFEKTAKSSWRINTLGVKDLTISYRLYANSLSNRTRHIDESHAFLSPSAVFMYCHELRHEPARVMLKLPAGWKVATGLSPDPARPDVLLAPDYDTLVDSPIECGLLDIRTFEVAGVPHEIAIWGAASAVPEKVAVDFAAIARVQHELFGSFPYSRYVFLTHVAAGASGGTEHLNSTIIQTRPTTFDTPKDYRGFLALASHELFHTWNVKRFRPRGLTPYDYQRENYTDLLWVAEGTTSYYDELLCVRAGVWSVANYLESLAKLSEAQLSRPGAAVQPLTDSSFDAWIKFNRPTPDSVNTTVSFYDKGAMVNLLLDVEIRSRTGNTKSLDDVMRELYRRFPLSGPGYTSADLLVILRDLTGSEFNEFFTDFVSGTTPMPIADALLKLGLEMKRPGIKDEDKSDPDNGGSEEAYTGIEVRGGDGAAAGSPGDAVVSAVRSDGPAFAAGLIAEDQIVAINGKRVRGSDFAPRIRKLKPGEEVTLTYFRRDELRTITLTLAGKPRGELKITKVKSPTPDQRAMFESWCGQKWE